MAGSPKLLESKKSTLEKVTDKAFASAANLVKLLPTTTVLIFQILSPALSNGGHCFTVNKYLTGFLLGTCGLSCFVDSFTDSYQSEDGKLYYGFATKTGLWTFDRSISGTVDLSAYKLRFIDFVHAVLSVLVFFSVAMMDTNIVSCYYPVAEKTAAPLLKILPIVVGSLCSLFFTVFPSKRHGIGYPSGKFVAKMVPIRYGLFIVLCLLPRAYLSDMAVMDTNIVNCCYPNAEQLLKSLPIVVGSLCSLFLMVFPSKRHGIGYPNEY